MTHFLRRRLLAGATFAASLALAPAAFAQHQGHDMGGHAAPPAADPHAGHDMSGHDMSGHDMGQMTADAPGHPMTSPLGSYPMERDASGTAWQPDESSAMAGHTMHGDWMTMGHALLNGVYVDQGGPRGGDKTYLAGMVMGMASRPLGAGTLGLKAMLSPDPLMGKRGYPLLLAAGESADGINPLVDRQHPHDLFMELSASYSVPVGEASSLFVYAGLPGEPAFGPPSFMHRQSGLDSPEAPISHHWLDSTHITFGVLTAGYVHRDWKIEASAFRGREPDESRWDIETGDLDSWSARLSWNPTAQWALQASYADIKSPEALEAHHDERRASASALYARRLDNGGTLAATFAVARKDRVPGGAVWAGLAEASYAPNEAWTLFTRAERVEQDELEEGHGEAHVVGRLSVGAIHDWKLTEGVKFGVGGLVQAFDIPKSLEDDYGDPLGAMAFVRLKIG